MNNVQEMLSRIGVWMSAMGVTALAYVVYGLNNDVTQHTSQFDTKWTQSFYEAIIKDQQYPLIHEEYRGLYVAQNEVFHEQVRQFMGAGGRFSKSDGDALEARIRRLETECAIIRTREAYRNREAYEENRNAGQD